MLIGSNLADINYVKIEKIIELSVILLRRINS